MILSVDLAAVYSAACLQDYGGRVHREYDSGQFEAVEGFLEELQSDGRDAEHIVVEDLPHALRFDSTTKAVARLQGRLIDRWQYEDVLDRVWFIPPALWQRGMPGVWRTGVIGSRTVALERYDYRPPSLLEVGYASWVDLHGKERQRVRNILQKRESDYVSAFLIGAWARETLAAQGTLSVPSAQQFVR